MKIRTGFVSNSSSSAFILIVKKDAYDEAFTKMDAAQKDFCKEFFHEDNIFGMKVMIHGNTIDRGGDYLECWDGPSSKEGAKVFAEVYEVEDEDDEWADANSKLENSVNAMFPNDAKWEETIGNG